MVTEDNTTWLHDQKYKDVLRTKAMRGRMEEYMDRLMEREIHVEKVKFQLLDCILSVVFAVVWIGTYDRSKTYSVWVLWIGMIVISVATKWMFIRSEAAVKDCRYNSKSEYALKTLTLDEDANSSIRQAAEEALKLKNNNKMPVA